MRMTSRSRDDILVSHEAAAPARSLRAQLAAFVPITVALLGVAVILVGGLPAHKGSLATIEAVDPIATGSIVPGGQ